MRTRRCPRCAAEWPGDRDDPAAGGPVVFSGAIVRRGGEVLLVRDDEPSSSERWSLPSGACRRDETPETSACRHVRRRTGLLVRLTGLHDVLALAEQDAVLVVYDATEVDGDLLPGEDAREVAFHPLDALPQVAPPPVRHLLSRLAAGVPRRW